MRVVKVCLADRTYSILIGRDLLVRLGAECGQLGLGRRCAVVADQTVAGLYGKPALESLRAAGFEALLVTFPSGEAAKSLRSVEDCYNQLAAQRLERSSFLVALGGGVVGDLAGFVAATYLRGIPFVQVPTTLLAQVDSSVGGKVGVNLKAGKNLIGAFYQPRLVICDLATLDTLPMRELRAGLAEVIKYGIIYDRALFRRIERDLACLLERQEQALSVVIARCCSIKAEVVAQDERESGLRAILNFGHTVGHALEAITGYGRFLHGEAISIGQVAAAYISAQILGLSPAEVGRIRALFDRAGLPTELKLTRAQTAQLLMAMRLDKKVRDGEVEFVLARRLGQVEFGHKAPGNILENALAALAGGAPAPAGRASRSR